MDTYECRLDNFTGPLDLLLHLVKEKKMDLLELSITEICDQYLAYIERHRDLYLETKSEYLVMAAYLLEAKSKMLLPVEKVSIQDDYEPDMRAKLIERLLTYKKYKDVVAALNIKKEEREAFYTKLPADMSSYEQEVAKIPQNLDPYALIQAMNRLMARKVHLRPLQSAVAQKEPSVEERTVKIKEYLSLHRHEKVNLGDLFEEGDRMMFVVTFLAVLILANQGYLSLDQKHRYDDVYVEVAP